MPKIQPTTTITVDDAVLVVEKLNPNIKQMISLMDEWRQEQVDLSSKLTMVNSALRDIQNNIYIAINKEREATAAKAAQMMKKDEPAATAPESE